MGDDGENINLICFECHKKVGEIMLIKVLHKFRILCFECFEKI